MPRVLGSVALVLALSIGAAIAQSGGGGVGGGSGSAGGPAGGATTGGGTSTGAPAAGATTPGPVLRPPVSSPASPTVDDSASAPPGGDATATTRRETSPAVSDPNAPPSRETDAAQPRTTPPIPNPDTTTSTGSVRRRAGDTAVPGIAEQDRERSEEDRAINEELINRGICPECKE